MIGTTSKVLLHRLRSLVSRFFAVFTSSYRHIHALLGFSSSHDVAVDPVGDSIRIASIGLLLIFITFGLGGLWAAFAPLAGAIIVKATVTVDSHHKTVQHLEGGIIKEILVHSGDRVVKGQPLITIENMQSSSMLEVLQLQLFGELAKAARLDAVRRGLDHLDFPSALLEKQTDPRVADIMQKEQSFFAAQRQTLEGQAQLLRTQVQEVSEQIKGLSLQLKSAAEGLSYLKEDMTKNSTLYEKNYISHSRLLELKRDMAARDERIGQYMTSISEAKQRKSELELRVINLYDEHTKIASEELKESTKRISDITERLRPIVDSIERQTIVAPDTGIVMDMKVATPGGVIAPREPLMDIVPEHAALIAEGDIKPDNVDDVSVGREVDLQLTAFRRRVTPMAKGRVTYISADIINKSATGLSEPHYLVKMSIDQDSIAKLNDDIVLTPGMPITAFIKTKERTALDYLLEPIVDTLRKGLREP